MKPLAVDLYCGLGGWSEGLLAEGFDVVGFDIERHHYGDHKYPGLLALQDVRTLHGSQFKHAALIVASPPCQAYSYRAMPWKRAKALPPPDNTLFNECFRIQREASEAAGHHIPLIVENVRGAQKWVGRARWNWGSFYLWGDVPALMPIPLKKTKVPGFRFDGSGGSFQSASVEHTKVPGLNWSGSDKPGYVAQAFNTTAEQRIREGVKAGDAGWRERGPGRQLQDRATSGKGQNPDGRKTTGHLNQRDGHTHARHLTNPAEHEGVKHHGSGEVWFDTGPAAMSSKSNSRKAASAMIAKIPLPLSRWIGRSFLAQQIQT